MIKKIGFACKINSSVGKADPSLNIKTTTITWLLYQSKAIRDQRLEELMVGNIKTLYNQVNWFHNQPLEQRMFRISSDILIGYTHKSISYFYESKVTRDYLEKELAKVGLLARMLGVRLSFHPGQFCVLASESDEIVHNSIQEFEYHCDLIRWMGFGKTFQDFKCNVHIGGKRGPQGIRDALAVLSPEARNVLTIENAEFTWQLQHSLELAKDCALVLDIHHHWIACGEYIDPKDARIQQVIESWRGRRPVIHYSCSREDVLVDHSDFDAPNLAGLLANGYTRQKLRAHSDFYWNWQANQWALEHLEWADIMLESKEKNLARDKFLKFKLELEEFL